ncbi:MAG: hypothetical protein ACOVK6_04615, partial [Ramlibacter sp.]
MRDTSWVWGAARLGRLKAGGKRCAREVRRKRQAGAKEKSQLLSELAYSWMARLAGFEPTTPWFVAKY